MKKRMFLALVAVAMLQGCISMSGIVNTANRLQGDIDYFQAELDRYPIVLGGGTHVDAARDMLEKAKQAAGIGDKISKKKYLSALVDIMDLLEDK